MSRQWINLPRSEGEVSRQAHADLPAGSYERELGRNGFFGPATHMYHRHAPTGWSHIEGPLRPRAYHCLQLPSSIDMPWALPVLLGNAHVNIRFWTLSENMPDLLRNADGDELLFVHQGSGELFCDYGQLNFREEDYLLLPRGTMWRINVSEALQLLSIEARGSAYTLPEKGLVGRHAIFDPAVLDAPAINARFREQQDERPWRLRVKRHERITTVSYPYNPLDAIGWHGDLMPLRLNWRDIRPLMSHRYHLPPSAHTTFVADRFVVCTFCPRPMESDPGALKVPFYHNNDDYDEVIFYHQGAFFSRDNIHPGMLTLHPGGITHGPHPQAFKQGQQAARKATDEVAVMIDARDALQVADIMQSVELHDYADSWRAST